MQGARQSRPRRGDRFPLGRSLFSLVPAWYVPVLNFFHLFGGSEIHSAKGLALRDRVKGDVEIAVFFNRFGKLIFSLSFRDVPVAVRGELVLCRSPL